MSRVTGIAQHEQLPEGLSLPATHQQQFFYRHFKKSAKILGKFPKT
jgi:hypothetical protein